MLSITKKPREGKKKGFFPSAFERMVSLQLNNIKDLPILWTLCLSA